MHACQWELQHAGMMGLGHHSIALGYAGHLLYKVYVLLADKFWCHTCTGTGLHRPGWRQPL